MLGVKHIALLAALPLIAGCVLAVDENATADVAAMSFSNVAMTEGAEARSVAETGTDVASIAEAAANPEGAGSGLFGDLFANAGVSANARIPNQISFGEQVAYGEMAAVCNAPRGGLGTMIASAGGFKIYDSNTGSTQLRPHYVTGFDDGCTRQFSAALTLTGDVGTHEVVRYLPRNRAAYNATDTAYEGVKSSYCRVRKGKPCGSRLDALARITTFLTAYETFGSRPRWVEILLHDGEMTAVDFKTD